MDTRRAQARSQIVPTLVLALAVASAAAPGVASLPTEELTISVSPNPGHSTSPLIVTITAFAPCAFLSPATFTGSTIDYVFDGTCPILPPSPSVYNLYDVLELSTGIYEVRVGTLDASQQFVVADSVTVTVTDPVFSVELTPSPATADDEVVARVQGQATCPYLDQPEITGDRIRIDVRQLPLGICDPPIPFGPFDFALQLGQLTAGDYSVEVYIEDQLAAQSDVQVLPSGTCLTRDSELCVGGGRFRIEAEWTTPEGATGMGTAVQETADTGFFWFFDPDNVELVVKVLNACNIEFNTYWVFAGGLTDVGVTLTVTDTWTETARVYGNPVGQRFETVADTRAFATCP